MPGSGANFIDASLTDADVLNPCNVAGVPRRTVLSAGKSTATAAIKTGAQFLQASKGLSTAGQGVLTGHVADVATGVFYPVWQMRPGDRLIVSDAHDLTPRKIVKISYDDSSKQMSVDLDAPPASLQALLERLQVTLSGAGFA